jgi:uncharacterized protein
MSKKIFVNLPIHNLKASMKFFEQLGFTFNLQFTDDNTTCMVISEDIFVMLLETERFQSFTPKPVTDAKQSTEVILALAYNSRAEVDDMVQRAVAAGGKTYNEPKDMGFMYQHGFQDLDGHIWEVFFMDPAHVQG